MHFPKSSPDLGPIPNGSRRSRRQSRSSKVSKEAFEYEFKILNPFRNGEEENCMPEHLRQQIQQMDYISSKSVKKINFPEQQAPRTSNFMRNLEMMQKLASKQENKYSGMVRQGEKSKTDCVYQIPENPQYVNLNEDDQISLQLNGFYDCRDRVDDDFNIFRNEMADNSQNDVIFYSNIELGNMDEEFNNYLQ